jgi:hypothetical protein
MPRIIACRPTRFRTDSRSTGGFDEEMRVAILTSRWWERSCEELIKDPAIITGTLVNASQHGAGMR